jgi:hypothetical protein
MPGMYATLLSIAQRFGEEIASFFYQGPRKTLCFNTRDISGRASIEQSFYLLAAKQ